MVDTQHGDGPDAPVRRHRPAHAPRRTGPRFFRRVALGALVPGSGLLRTPWAPVGWVVLLAFLAGLGWVAWSVHDQGLLRFAGDLVVDARTIRTAEVVVMVGAVLWVGTVVLTAQQAWLRGRPGGWFRGVFAALACLLVAVPAGAAVRDLEAQASLIGTVLVATPDLPEPKVRPKVEKKDPWKDVDRVNLVLLGSDAGPDRIGVRTDSMMVVSINPQTGDTLLVGVPRNLERVPIPQSNPLHALYPNGYDCGDQCLMNGIWTLAGEHADLFPKSVRNPGLTSTLAVLGEVTGLQLDRSVVIDLRGFQQLVDAMGGVDVNVTQRVCTGCHSGTNGGILWSTSKHEWIEPGRQHLDGYHALWYARSRAGNDDFNRMRRQRCVAGALLEQADPLELFARFPQIAAAVKQNVSVGIPRAELPAWVDLVQRIQKAHSIRSLPLTARVISPANPDFAKIRRLVHDALIPPATPTPTATPTSTGSPSATKAPRPTKSAQPDENTAQSLTATC